MADDDDDSKSFFVWSEDEVAGGAGPAGHDRVEGTYGRMAALFSIVRRPWVILLVVLGVVAVWAVVATRRPAPHPSSHQPAASSAAQSSTTALPTPGPTLSLGAGSAVDLLMTDSLLWVLEDNPSRLVRVVAQSGTPAGQVRAAAGAFRLVSNGAQVWVVAVRGGATVVRAYDQNSLGVTANVRLPFVSRTAVFASGQLWLGGPNGLYALRPGAAVAVRVADFSGPVTALAADPAHDQLLVATPAKDGSTRLAAVSTATTRITRTVTINLSKPSIAITPDGTWIAGDGGPHHVLRLDERTLQPSANSQTNSEIQAGARVWAGQSVIWVSPIDEHGGLACLSPNTGQIIGRWPTVDGPVVSGAATAYSINRRAMVVPLPITHTCFPG